MPGYLMLVCSSSEKGACRKRLQYYVERRFDGRSLKIERVPCPFYSRDSCKIEGKIGAYIQGYPQDLTTYEKKGNKVIEIPRPREPAILKLHK